MLNEREVESCYLGQFIPVHYHHNMLMDQNRMANFKAAIDHAVFPGAKVVELGGGTGVLSWFAAARASKVWCVEYNPDLVGESRKFLAQNANGHKVEVIEADAFDYLPPEPVDVVICEMIHVAMLREKQVQVIESFKRRYRERFGGRMPVFLPEAVIMAVQPIQQAYSFFGYNAPIVQFQPHQLADPGTVELGVPAVYKTIDFTQDNDTKIVWAGRLIMRQSGTLNALRFITKNVLAVQMEQGTTIDWLNHYMAVPLDVPVKVQAGDRIDVRLEYRAGNSIQSLQHSLKIEYVDSGAMLEQACA